MERLTSLDFSDNFADRKKLSTVLCFSLIIKVATRRESLAKGMIAISNLKRLGFGSFFKEGYNYIAWKPLLTLAGNIA